MKRQLQTMAKKRKIIICHCFFPDSSGTPGEEEEGESKEDQQKVSLYPGSNSSSLRVVHDNLTLSCILSVVLSVVVVCCSS